jgi:hypothetical protein
MLCTIHVMSDTCDAQCKYVITSDEQYPLVFFAITRGKCTANFYLGRTRCSINKISLYNYKKRTSWATSCRIDAEISRTVGTGAAARCRTIANRDAIDENKHSPSRGTSLACNGGTSLLPTDHMVVSLSYRTTIRYPSCEKCKTYF